MIDRVRDAKRDPSNGQFGKDNTAAVNRAPRATGKTFLDAIKKRLTDEAAEQIVDVMITAALNGDHRAWELLFRYGVGSPDKMIQLSPYLQTRLGQLDL